MKEDGKLAVVFSGGLDSTVLLHEVHKLGKVGAVVTVDYGQRHVCEVLAADAVLHAMHLQDLHVVAELPNLGAAIGRSSSQCNHRLPVPHGHYQDETMRTTVVPNRNMILLAIALGVAIDRGCIGVAYGAHAGDHAIYPDCRLEFVGAMKLAANLCHYEPLYLEAPYGRFKKWEIVKRGADLGVPFHLTWSCYEGAARPIEKHCGRCGACVERREAFLDAGVADPTEYLA